MTDQLKFEKMRQYAEIYRQAGPWCTVYTGASTGTVDTLEAADVRPANVRDALATVGAPRADLDAVEEAVRPATGEPSPVSRFVLVRGGTVVLNELLPGPRIAPERATFDAIPDLLPLFKHQPKDFPYVVAEVGRDGGEIRLQTASRSRASETHEVAGTTEDLKKVPGGGWAQGRFQHRTEDIWRRNGKEVAAEINRVVQASGARLVVLAGDIRARGMVEEELSEAAKAILSVVDSHTRTGGADHEALGKIVELRVAEVIAYGQKEMLERLAVQEGHVNRESTTGLGAVVHALQQAQVKVLMLDDAALADHKLLALDSEPWLATADGQTPAGQVLGKVPAAAAMLRAAVLTEAETLLLPGAALPAGTHVAALLRWPTGPAMPSESGR